MQNTDQSSSYYNYAYTTPAGSDANASGASNYNTAAAIYNAAVAASSYTPVASGNYNYANVKYGSSGSSSYATPATANQASAPSNYNAAAAAAAAAFPASYAFPAAYAPFYVPTPYNPENVYGYNPSGYSGGRAQSWSRAPYQRSGVGYQQPYRRSRMSNPIVAKPEAGSRRGASPPRSAEDKWPVQTRAMLNEGDPEAPPVNMKPGEHWCRICLKVCHGEENYLRHLGGRNHQKRLENARAPPPLMPGSVMCPYCKITCTCDSGWQDHLKGKKHKQRVAKMRETDPTLKEEPEPVVLVPKTSEAEATAPASGEGSAAEGESGKRPAEDAGDASGQKKKKKKKKKNKAAGVPAGLPRPPAAPFDGVPVPAGSSAAPGKGLVCRECEGEFPDELTLSVHRLGRAHQKPDLSEPRAAVEKRLLEAAMSVLPPPEEVAALDALVRAVSEVLTGSGLCSEVRPAGHFAKGTMLRDTWATEVAAVLREPPASLDTLRATLARLHLALASDAALQPYQVELDPEGTNLIIAAREGRANAAVCVGWLVPAEGPSMPADLEGAPALGCAGALRAVAEQMWLEGVAQDVPAMRPVIRLLRLWGRTLAGAEEVRTRVWEVLAWYCCHAESSVREGLQQALEAASVCFLPGGRGLVDPVTREDLVEELAGGVRDALTAAGRKALSALLRGELDALLPPSSTASSAPSTTTAPAPAEASAPAIAPGGSTSDSSTPSGQSAS